MSSYSQIEIMKALVLEQQNHIKQLEQRISFQDFLIQQYESERHTADGKIKETVDKYSEMLREATELRDRYRQLVSEIIEAKVEYDGNLADLISTVRKMK